MSVEENFQIISEFKVKKSLSNFSNLNKGKLSKEQIVFFAAEIVNILEYLHNFGIAHRDMKVTTINTLKLTLCFSLKIYY